MGDMVRCSSDDMDSPYDMDTDDSPVITINHKFSLFITTDYKYTHNSTNNLLICIYNDDVKPDIYFFPKKSYYDESDQWVIT